MNKEPETYEELLRQKRCIDLTKYYNLTMDDLERIYTFLETYKNCKIYGNKDNLYLNNMQSSTNDFNNFINTPCIDPTVDGCEVSNTSFKVIPHFEPSSSSSSWSSGGSSSNNNNNNNNNNNR